MHADICTGKYVQGALGGYIHHWQTQVVRNGYKEQKRKRFGARRIKGSLDGIECGLIRSFSVAWTYC